MIILSISFILFIMGIILFIVNLKQKKKIAILALTIGLVSITTSIFLFISEQNWVNSFIKYKQFYDGYTYIDNISEYRNRALKFNEELKNKRYDKALYGEWILVSNKVFDLNKISVNIPRNK